MGNVTYDTDLFCPSERVLFASQAAALAWGDSLNLAPASGSTPGAVGQATLPAAISTTVTPTYTYINALNADGSISTFQVASKADYDALLALANEIKAAYNNLRTAMMASGQGV